MPQRFFSSKYSIVAASIIYSSARYLRASVRDPSYSRTVQQHRCLQYRQTRIMNDPDSNSLFYCIGIYFRKWKNNSKVSPIPFRYLNRTKNEKRAAVVCCLRINNLPRENRTKGGLSVTGTLKTGIVFKKQLINREVNK